MPTSPHSSNSSSKPESDSKPNSKPSSRPSSKPKSKPKSNPESESALRGFERKHLRKLAHPLRPVVHVGAAGMSTAVLRALDQALTDHELIKVRMHEPEDKKDLASQLSRRSGAELCGLVGHTVILYRRHPDEPRIELPERQ